MEINEAISARVSIRGFKPDPVPRATIQEILTTATRAPSGKNIQAWEIAVLTGNVLDRIREDNVAAFLAGEAERPDAPIAYPSGVYREREVEIAKSVLNVMGIRREDKEKRAEWLQRGFRYFDAPVAVLVICDRNIDILLAHHDIGSLSQTFCLAALSYGLGTCIVRQGVLYPDAIRRQTDIPVDKSIISAIALGWPDPDFPANRVRSPRLSVDEITTWSGFEEGPD
jgi:nitroreductase